MISSGPVLCLASVWVQRSKTTTEAVVATGLNTSIIAMDDPDKLRCAEVYNPIPESTRLPDCEHFFKMVKAYAPEACILDT